MKEETYSIGGMHCAACSSSVERVTRKLPGVERSDVNLPLNRMTIVYDETQTTPEMIVAKVEKAGFTAAPFNEDGPVKPQTDDGEAALRAERNSLIAAVVFSVSLLYVSMGSMLPRPLPLPALFNMMSHPVNFALLQLLLTIPVLFLGRRFFTGGFKSLLHGNPNMDALVAISCTASFAYSLAVTFQLSDNGELVHGLYYESAAIVITLILLGKHMEARSKAKTTGAIKALMALTPDTAILIREDRQWEVPTETLKIGDLVLVKPGAKVPLDGVVKSGEGGVDEAMLTGESLPVEKTAGSEVIGGSISVSGALYVEITRVGRDTTLSKIIRFVEDAQGKKAPISKTADKVAGVFVPVVIVIALAALVVWLLAGEDFAFALKVFTSVLVIACPCAMGLATPTAIIVGTGLGAQHGILIRSGEALETTHKTAVCVLDKTGTVTEGKPRVTKLVSREMPEDDFLALAASAEALSGHPLAKAVTEEAANRQLAPAPAPASFEDLPGRGIRAATADGRTLLIGNRRLMEDEHVDISALAADVEALTAEGQTALLAALDGKALGLLAVADTVKDTSRAAIEKLRSMGVRTVLLTGDNRAAAEHIGGLVGVDEVVAEVLPGEKAAQVERLQKDGAVVMMVGDGINDAPALAQADIGCAIGNGSDIAIESADVVLMKSDLNDVPAAIKLSRLTITNIKQNLFWAFCYNTLGIPVAAGVLYPAFHILLSPMIGALAMSLSSIFVVSNALRLKGKKL